MSKLGLGKVYNVLPFFPQFAQWTEVPLPITIKGDFNESFPDLLRLRTIPETDSDRK